MTDIRNGVNAGKTVTVHNTQIIINSWSGTGYIILDPESGAGAYMIAGGLDGGATFIGGFASGVLVGFGLGLVLSGTAASIGLVLLILALAYYSFLYYSIKNYGTQEELTCLTTGAFLGGAFGFAAGAGSPNPVIALLVFGWFNKYQNFKTAQSCL